MKLSLIIFAGLLSIGVFLSMALFVSSRTERSSNSFLILLSLWIMTVMIIPRLSVASADLFVNVPSLDEINSQKSRFMSQIWNEDRTKMNSFVPPKTQDMQQVMGEFNKFMQSLADEREKKFNEFAARLNDGAKPSRTAAEPQLFSGISPSALFTLAASEITGTSLRLEKEYLAQARSYRRIYEIHEGEAGMESGFSMVFRMVTDDNAAKPKPINIGEVSATQFFGTICFFGIGILCRVCGASRGIQSVILCGGICRIQEI